MVRTARHVMGCHCTPRNQDAKCGRRRGGQGGGGEGEEEEEEGEEKEEEEEEEEEILLSGRLYHGVQWLALVPPLLVPRVTPARPPVGQHHGAPLAPAAPAAAKGLADIARRVVGRHLTQEKSLKCLSMTCRAIAARPYRLSCPRC